VKVAASIHTLGGFSAHGDQRDLLRWYAGVPGKPPVWLVHGEAAAAEGFRDALQAQGTVVTIPQPGDRLDLRGTQ
jgi:metallo-beta-lactamase family protein